MQCSRKNINKKNKEKGKFKINKICCNIIRECFNFSKKGKEEICIRIRNLCRKNLLTRNRLSRDKRKKGKGKSKNLIRRLLWGMRLKHRNKLCISSITVSLWIIRIDCKVYTMIRLLLRCRRKRKWCKILWGSNSNSLRDSNPDFNNKE